METYNVSEELNQTFGAPGTESRRQVENQAWEEYNAQILLDARKEHPHSSATREDSPTNP